MSTEPEDSELRIEAPIELLPDLSDWGIEEFERGTCENTLENRRALRENKARWMHVYSATGEITEYIQVVTSEMMQAALLKNKSVLLVDRRDVDSDYIQSTALIIEPAADSLVPMWVLASTRHWEDVAQEREDRKGTDKKLYRPALAGPPGRCIARRMDGHRCQHWHGGRVDEAELCKVHMSNRPNVIANRGISTVARARNRLLAASVAAVEELESLVHNATSEPVRLGAANSLLDRSGLRMGIEIEQKVEVHVVPASDIVRERLQRLAENQTARELTVARETAAELEEITVEVEVEND
jgi:hypothetical protein